MATANGTGVADPGYNKEGEWFDVAGLGEAGVCGLRWGSCANHGTGVADPGYNKATKGYSSG